MDFGRQLIRFSLPGGLFGLLVGLYLELFREAWRVLGTVADKQQLDVPLDPLTQNFIATAVGLLVAGFVIYQTYYVFYRPEPRFLWRNLRMTRDRGGAILHPLAEVPGLSEWVERHTGSALPSKELPHHVTTRSKEDRETWYENNALVRSLLIYAAQHDGEEIKADVTYRADMYHALGACRLAAPIAAMCTCIYALAVYHANVTANLVISACAILVVFASTAFLVYIFDSNRKNTWYALTSQARQSLLIWFTTHPESPCVTAPVAEVEPTAATAAHEDGSAVQE